MGVALIYLYNSVVIYLISVPNGNLNLASLSKLCIASTI